MAKEDMTPVRNTDFGTKWNVKNEEFRKDAPSNYREGYLVGVTEMTPNNASPYNIYSFQPVGADGKFGEKYSLSSDKDLKDKLSNVPLKSFVGIEYMGKKPNKDKAKNAFNTWFVGVMQNAPTYEAAQAKNISLGGSASPVSAPAQASGANTEVTEDQIPF